MARLRIQARVFIDGQAVMNVMPMIRRDISRIDAEHLNGIDHLQQALDLRPAGQTQQNLSARCHIRDGRTALSRSDCAQDVDPRNDCPKVAGRPSDEGKDAAGCK